MPSSTMNVDHMYDIVVVGTGAAAFAAALGAVDEGMSVILLESTAKWGGNSAMSGGGMWLPNNPLMQRDGVGDSREEALAYLDATVGEAGRATSRARKEAFVDGVADFVETAQKYGMKLVRPIEIAQQVGAAVELMDDAWWGASAAPVRGGVPSFVVGERSFPYCIIVDAQGDRFANESESYVDLGHHMLEHDKDGPYWLIAEARHARRYLRSYAMDPKTNRAMKKQGIMAKARTLDTLAPKIGIDPAKLAGTVARFNGFARAGVDGDFDRGNSAYDRYYSDPLVHPNPNLGPLEKGPFTAVKLVIGDLGTKGGVLTDADARALREDGSVIEGLYSAGNNSASVMGHTYPGPGSTLAPAVVFGLRAARHMARRAS